MQGEGVFVSKNIIVHKISRLRVMEIAGGKNQQNCNHVHTNVYTEF